MRCGHTGCALLSSPSSFKISENSDPRKNERPWEYIPHIVVVIKCGNLWHKEYMHIYWNLSPINYIDNVERLIVRVWKRSTEVSGISRLVDGFFGILETSLELLSEPSCESLGVGWHCETKNRVDILLECGHFFFGENLPHEK